MHVSATSSLFEPSPIHFEFLNFFLNPSILYITCNPSRPSPNFLSLSQLTNTSPLVPYLFFFFFFDIHIHLIFLISFSIDSVSLFLAMVCLLLDFVSLIPSQPCLYWDSMGFVSSRDVCFKETL